MYVLTPVCMSAHYTEASKKILQYLAACSGHAGAVDVVKDRLLESTPVLEVCTYVCVCYTSPQSTFHGLYNDLTDVVT